LICAQLVGESSIRPSERAAAAQIWPIFCQYVHELRSRQLNTAINRGWFDISLQPT
jgi:hypothetical protein